MTRLIVMLWTAVMSLSDDASSSAMALVIDAPAFRSIPSRGTWLVVPRFKAFPAELAGGLRQLISTGTADQWKIPTRMTEAFALYTSKA